MKKLITIASVLLPFFGFANNYSIDWYKVSGGGGTSVGGQYSVNGTIGQHDAGTAMNGGRYSVTGGFWSMISVLPTTGAPLLTITPSGSGGVVISWPTPADNWTLQQNSDLANGAWAASSYPVTSSGGTNSITIPSPMGNLYFRLHGP